ncbi:hypothetical protein [Desulfoscipio gibsoniae]|uniref:Uncharacterized protein n=1 Tax=Desulfoscipio gibsoniae DSM 7213 TaxID=767817 RepID=R4KPG7_9FIRM|nr:hypothetical protein [Desulfoscipio gibsoniae]AGL02485.1 hypothetical protein Desgi_3125 [Desulfoscipio gibsoniae DSM 7213]
MPMEQEVMPLLITGVAMVMIFSLVIMFRQWRTTKNNAHAWIVAHLVMLSISIYQWLKLIGTRQLPQNSMLSENNSLLIGSAAVYWAISMGLLVIGIYKLGNRQKY